MLDQRKEPSPSRDWKINRNPVKAALFYIKGTVPWNLFGAGMFFWALYFCTIAQGMNSSITNRISSAVQRYILTMETGSEQTDLGNENGNFIVTLEHMEEGYITDTISKKIIVMAEFSGYTIGVRTYVLILDIMGKKPLFLYTEIFDGISPNYHRYVNVIDVDNDRLDEVFIYGDANMEKKTAKAELLKYKDRKIVNILPPETDGFVYFINDINGDSLREIVWIRIDTVNIPKPYACQVDSIGLFERNSDGTYSEHALRGNRVNVLYKVLIDFFGLTIQEMNRQNFYDVMILIKAIKKYDENVMDVTFVQKELQRVFNEGITGEGIIACMNLKKNVTALPLLKTVIDTCNDVYQKTSAIRSLAEISGKRQFNYLLAVLEDELTKVEDTTFVSYDWKISVGEIVRRMLSKNDTRGLAVLIGIATSEKYGEPLRRMIIERLLGDVFFDESYKTLSELAKSSKNNKIRALTKMIINEKMKGRK